MGEYPDAIDYYVDRSRVFADQNSHSAIVLHCTGGGDGSQTVEELGNWFASADNTARTSTHFGIDRRGRVAQYVRLSDGAAGNCCIERDYPYDPFWNQFAGDNLNLHTISIECVNNDANSLPLAEPQKTALFKLVAWLCEKYNLGTDRIKTHQSIAPRSRARCPGPVYPLTELIEFLNNGGSTMLTYGPNSGDFGAYFTVAPDGNWICPRFNTVIIGGNKGLFSQLSIDGNTLPIIGLPRTNELYQQEADGYSWSVQFCERGLIVYDPKFRWDSAPGMGASYMGKYDQFKQYDPLYKVSQISDKLIADIKAIKVASDRLLADSGVS